MNIEQLTQTVKLFSLPMTREETFKVIVDEAVAYLNATYGSIVLLQANRLQRVYSSVPFAFKTTQRKKGNTQKAINEQEIQIAHITEMEKAHPELVEMGIKCTIFIPLIDVEQNTSLGVLTLNFSKNHLLTPQLKKELTLFSLLAVSAIKRVQYYEERYDALTMRDQFLSIISHEIRNPLTTIYGYLELSKKRIDSNEPIKKEWVDISLHHINQIVTKIKDLINANDISSGVHLTFSFDEIDLSDLLARMIKIFVMRFPHRELILKSPIPSSMKAIGDISKLEYVFQNMLENSVKFSPPETVITLQIKEDLRQYTLILTDEGRGMSKDEMRKIMKGFYKALQDSRQGMGVGIYLSDYILKTHHGSLRISSRINSGTKVTIKLPKSNI